MGRRQLLPYFLVSGSMSLGYGSIYTLLADLRDRFGFSGTQLGLIVAAGFFAGFCAQLFLARYADRGYIAFMVRGGVSWPRWRCWAARSQRSSGRSFSRGSCSGSAAVRSDPPSAES